MLKVIDGVRIYAESIIMPSVVVLSVILLDVVAPFRRPQWLPDRFLNATLIGV
jgi:hypothetical protein